MTQLMWQAGMHKIAVLVANSLGAYRSADGPQGQP